MTVRDLIEALTKHEPDLPVVFPRAAIPEDIDVTAVCLSRHRGAHGHPTCVRVS